MAPPLRFQLYKRLRDLNFPDTESRDNYGFGYRDGFQGNKRNRDNRYQAYHRGYWEGIADKNRED